MELSLENMRTAVHELQVRQAELETENAKLRARLAESEKSPTLHAAENQPRRPRDENGRTAQTEAERILQTRSRQLEQVVQQSAARLQEALSELEQFSYTLVHDLRAPLRTIRGFSDLLLTECADLDLVHKQYLQRTGAAVERMDRLILDALSYNKIVLQNFILGPMDCSKLLDEVIESYPEFRHARSNITVEHQFPPVLGNPALLTQCFSNLLSNALKFVPPGRIPSVHVSAQDLGRRVRINVQDNGIGICKDCHEKIFGMFQRLNVDYEGTGIGLALVRKAAQRMHGVVGLESEPGDGSRFWIELDKATP